MCYFCTSKFTSTEGVKKSPLQDWLETKYFDPYTEHNTFRAGRCLHGTYHSRTVTRAIPWRTSRGTSFPHTAWWSPPPWAESCGRRWTGPSRGSSPSSQTPSPLWARVSPSRQIINGKNKIQNTQLGAPRLTENIWITVPVYKKIKNVLSFCCSILKKHK